MSRYDNIANSTPSKSTSNRCNDDNNIDVRRRSSIPRKQIGSTTHTPSASVTSTSPKLAGFSAEGREQPAPPVPQHDMPLSQQARHQDYSPEPEQYRSSPTQAHSKMPSTQQNIYGDSSYRPTSAEHDPLKYQREGLPSRDVSRQGKSGAGREYSHPYETQSTSPLRDYSDYTPDVHHDSYVAPLYVRSKHTSKDPARGLAAEDIVERAKTNTYDTEVIEKIAPGQWCEVCYSLFDANTCTSSYCS